MSADSSAGDVAKDGNLPDLTADLLDLHDAIADASDAGVDLVDTVAPDVSPPDAVGFDSEFTDSEWPDTFEDDSFIADSFDPDWIQLDVVEFDSSEADADDLDVIGPDLDEPDLLDDAEDPQEVVDDVGSAHLSVTSTHARLTTAVGTPAWLVRRGRCAKSY